ncbi:hypothetical protein BGP78_13655 [Pseudoalteromonas sp. MSK9-3]|uniref:hypothetical protein n=1 Tax=Pseudoalteromonas sp. MSK9-3 TaxID=1897633 RepID=UPI000E6C902B|nr:hypothetical protein [Pseudoalteromonas sp. MSK9-3]RJE76054.1 hypothetical protein BGP78_13655 [Pseudoalteromonas sp. MSK9-3]
MTSELMLLVGAICAYLLPIGLISGSRRTHKHEKNAWLIGTLVFSWLALLMYFSIIPKQGMKPKRKRR